MKRRRVTDWTVEPRRREPLPDSRRRRYRFFTRIIVTQRSELLGYRHLRYRRGKRSFLDIRPLINCMRIWARVDLKVAHPRHHNLLYSGTINHHVPADDERNATPYRGRFSAINSPSARLVPRLYLQGWRWKSQVLNFSSVYNVRLRTAVIHNLSLSLIGVDYRVEIRFTHRRLLRLSPVERRDPRDQ